MVQLDGTTHGRRYPGQPQFLVYPRPNTPLNPYLLTAASARASVSVVRVSSSAV